MHACLHNKKKKLQKKNVNAESFCASSMELPRSAAAPPRLFLQGISRIKPQMMHQVLSSISTVQSQQRNTNNNASCEQLGGPKLMQLFPQRKSEEQQQQQQNEFDSSSPCCRSVTMDPHDKGNMCELTIIYKGAVNVYRVAPDKAQQITKLANSTLSKDPAPVLQAQETPAFASAADSCSPNEQSRRLAAGEGGLALVRKQSLQRFLQKRKDRLNSVAPFPVSKTQIPSSIRRAFRQEDQDLLLKLSLVSPLHRMVSTQSENSTTLNLHKTNGA